jgi:integrase
LSLYKRKSIWYHDISINGVRIRISTRTKNRKLAEKIYAQQVLDVEEGRWFEKRKAKSISFREMVEKYLKKYHRIRDEHTVKKLLPAFGNLALSEVSTELISDYRDERLKKVKPATVYQELSLMRRMFNVARKEWKWTRDNPAADLSFSVGSKNARDRWLTMEQEQLLIDKATNPSWLRPLLIMALHTGMRKGEILSLQWMNVDFARKLIMIVKAKNGEKRSIPMSERLFETLQGIKVRDISGRVFTISNRSLRVAFDRALTKAGIGDFRFHDLRHTFATRLVQNGVDQYKVKELLGHKTVAMTVRYAHHYPESLRSGIAVLDHLHDMAQNWHTQGRAR